MSIKALKIVDGVILNIGEFENIESIPAEYTYFENTENCYIGGEVVGSLCVPRQELPTPYHFFNHDGSISTDEEALKNLRDFKLKEAKTSKNSNESSGFIINISGQDIVFDSDEKAELRYNGLDIKFNRDPSYSEDWESSDGVWVVMNSALYDKVVEGMSAHISLGFSWIKSKQEEIEACQTIECLESISTVFGE